MSMPPVLTEAASSRSRTTKSEKQKAISPSKVLEEIEQHVLLDGFKIVSRSRQKSWFIFIQRRH